MELRHNAITDVEGVRVGHATNTVGVTGCTVVLFDRVMVGGVDVRGSASGTRDVEPLGPLHLVDVVHAVALTGGSAFGLAAAEGVMRYLRERGVGFRIRAEATPVPIVPAAVIFDLGIGDPEAYPGPEMGYEACLQASGGDVPRGNVGAGVGATVGKLGGIEQATMGGVGTASVSGAGGLVVGALAVVNAFGDVVDPRSGRIVAGARRPVTGDFVNTALALREGGQAQTGACEATTIGVVATNARLGKAAVVNVAQMAQDGLARAIAPVHTMYDGDTIFAVAPAGVATAAGVTRVGTMAADAMVLAILDAVGHAEGVGGIPSARALGSLG